MRRIFLTNKELNNNFFFFTSFIFYIKNIDKKTFTDTYIVCTPRDPREILEDKKKKTHIMVEPIVSSIAKFAQNLKEV